MAAKKKTTSKVAKVVRQPAEIEYADQLEALAKADKDPRPPNWKLSPRAVLHYITGEGPKTGKTEITRKFYGDDNMVERAIVTLASERALLLVGEPGTGKSWLSEHLAAAVSGSSTLTVQGTAGTTEDHIKYSWNIADVIAKGPSSANLIPSPTMVAMKSGTILRFEEITRCVPDVQDSLVSILSDKAIAVPELPNENTVWAQAGFNIMATANTRDQGVNELSAALKRRFNYIHIPIIADKATEVAIVQQRARELLKRYELPVEIPPSIIDMLATVFREIRNGRSEEGVGLKQPSHVLSTAEAIGVALESALRAQYFGKGSVEPGDLARNIVGSVVKEDFDDLAVLKEYNTVVAKKRGSKDRAWKEFHKKMLETLKS